MSDEQPPFTIPMLIAECNAHWDVMPRHSSSWEAYILGLFYDHCRRDLGRLSVALPALRTVYLDNERKVLEYYDPDEVLAALRAAGITVKEKP